MTKLPHRLVVLAATLGALAVGPSAASAAPTIVNTGTWYAGQSLGNTNPDGRLARYYVLVRHDAGTTVSGIRIDDDLDGTDNTSSGTVYGTVTKPAGPFNYSIVEASKEITASAGMSCPFIGTRVRRVSGRTVRIRAVQSDAQTSASSSFTDARFVANTSNCLGSEDYAYLYDQQDPLVNATPGQSVSFRFKGNDIDAEFLGDGAGRFTSINWRLRNLDTGATTSLTNVSFGPGDNTERTLTINAPSTRGAWVVEAEALSSDATNNPGYFYFVGVLNVNAAAGPTVSVSGIPDHIRQGQTYTGTVNVADADGRVQMVEIDADDDGTYEQRRYVGGPGETSTNPLTQDVSLASRQFTMNVTGRAPGATVTVPIRVTDNGAFNAADAARRVTTTSFTTITSRRPVMDDATGEAQQPGDVLIALPASDPDGDTITRTVLSPPANGTATIEGAGVRYDPASTFQGTETFTVRADDGLGETDDATVTANVRPDTTIDSASVAAGAATQDQTPSFAFFSPQTGTEGFECRLDSSLGGTGSWGDCDAGTYEPPSALGDDTYVLNVRTKGDFGRDLTPATWTFRVDTTRPVTTFTSGPDGPTNDTTPSWTFTTADAGPFTQECRFHAAGDPPGAWSSCAGSFAPGTLGEGEYVLEVRATDEVGLVEAPAARREIRVDTTAPETTVISGPEGEVAADDATFTFGSSEAGSTFSCSLDPAGAAPPVVAACDDGDVTYDDLPDGTYTFAVTATDPALNADPTPATQTFTVDTTAPGTAIDSGPAPVTRSARADIAFSSPDADVARFECRLDGGAWERCTSIESYVGLSEGAHEVAVRAVDRVENTDPTPATFAWTVDRTRPATSFTAAPAPVTNDAEPDFSFSADEPVAGYECRWLALGSLAPPAPPAPCTSPVTLGPLTDGRYVLQVRATDLAGNVETAYASRSFAVDTQAPDLVVEQRPDAVENSDTAQLSFSALEQGDPAPEAAFECALNGGATAPCDAELELTGLPEGDNELVVRAVDAAGNRSAPQTVAWVVDTTDPTDPRIDASDPEAGQRAASDEASVAFSADDQDVAFECRLDAGSWEDCASPHRLTGLADGARTFAVRVRDAAGNRSGTDAITWTVDTTAPQTTLTGGPDGLTRDAEPRFTWDVDEAGATTQCRIDGGAWSACASGDPVTGLTQGAHRFEVRARDGAVPAPNVEQPPARRAFTLDSVAPQTRIDDGPPATVTDGKAALRFSSDEPGLRFECRLDDGAWTACTSPWSVEGLVDGAHTMAVRGVDDAGNKDTPAPSRTFTAQAPSASGGGGQTTGGSFQARLLEGSIKIGSTTLPLPADSVGLAGDLAGDGKLSIPKAGFTAQPQVLDLQAAGVGTIKGRVGLFANGDGTGTLAPSGGSGSLAVSIGAKLEAYLPDGNPLLGPSSNCLISPVALNLNATEWSPTAKRLVLEDSSATVPAGDAGCGALGTQVNATLGLPAATGNAVRLVFAIGEAANPGAAAAIPTPPARAATTAPSTSPAARLTVPRGTALRADRRGRVTVGTRCTGAVGTRCQGSLRLVAKVRRKTRTVSLELGRVTYRVSAGRSANVRVTLTRAGRRVLSTAKGRRLRVGIALLPRGARRATTARTVTLRAAARRTTTTGRARS